MKTYINSSKSKSVDSNTKHTCGTNETSVPFLANPGRYTSQDERQSCLTPQHILDLMSVRIVGDCVFLPIACSTGKWLHGILIARQFFAYEICI